MAPVDPLPPRLDIKRFRRELIRKWDDDFG
jgi:hypothetical protein